MQVDYTSTFLQAKLDDEVCVGIACGFKQDGKLLKLKRSINGLRQSLRNFFLYVKNKLTYLDFFQRKSNPYLFVRFGILFLVYVDDYPLFTLDASNFEFLLTKLRNLYLSFHKEDNVAGL